MRTSKTAALLATLSLGTYACGDSPTPLAPPDAGSARKAASPDRAEFTCSYSRRDPDDPSYYHYGWIRYHIPKQDFADASGMVSYRVYFERPGEQPVRVLHCVLPNSPTVLASMNEHVAHAGAASTSRTAAGRHDAPGASTGAALTSGPGDLPTVVVIAPPIDGYLGGGGNWGNGWGPDASHEDTGGAPSEPPPPPVGSCFQSTDPGCNVPLTQKDVEVINASLAWMRDTSQIPDPTARKECAAMWNAFSTLVNEGHVYRGAYNTPADDPYSHRGAYDQDSHSMHYDPQWLDSAATGNPKWVQDLMNTALHEAAHSLGYDHADAMPSPFGPLYSDDYFKFLSPGDNSCLSWNFTS